MKKHLTLLMGAVMAAGLLSGCGSSGDETKAVESTVAAAEQSAQASQTTQAESGGEAGTSEEEITLHVYGPGLFAEQGEKGSLDMITGEETPGYDVVVNKWNELHPNVHVEIEAVPWENWQSSIQTAVLGGGIDLILHGASICDLVEPLDSYLEADPEFRNQIYAVEQRRTDAVNDLSVSTTTGIQYVVDPMIVYLDKDIFEHYGVELPGEDWTWGDMLAMAEKMTGTDPVTGKQTYGVQLVDTNSTANSFFNYQMMASGFDAKVITYGKTPLDSKVDFTGDGTVKALKMLQDLGQYCSSNVREGVNVDKTLTAENDTAIRWDQSAYKHYKEAKAAGVEDKFVFWNMPAIEAGEYKGKPSAFMGSNNVAICKTSENKEWAWEFLKFISTDETVLKWVSDCGRIPNNPSGMEFVKTEMGDKVQAINRAMEEIPDGFNNSTNDFFNNVSFGPVTSTMGVVISDLLNQVTTPEEAAKTLQNSVDEYLKSIQ